MRMAGLYPSMSPLAVSILVGLTGIFGYFFTKLYHARALFLARKRQGLPVAPEHSLLFGHLLYLKKFLDRLPKDGHYQYGFATIAKEEFADYGAFYIDLWPVSGLFLIVISPKAGLEITQENYHLASERPKLIERFMKPIAGGTTIFDLDEPEWKAWRAIFNKGFQSDRIMALVPSMVEETITYSKILKGYAERKELCHLDPITLRFMIDMIARTVLGAKLGAQNGYHVLADCMLSQIEWHSANAEINPFEYLNFPRHYMQWQNGRKMNQYIGAELDRRYAAYRDDPHSANSTTSVMDLVLQSYMDQVSRTKGSLPNRLDSAFRTSAISHMRLFIFTGHDSTSSVICYAFYLLSKNPSTLSLIRAEHERVLGLDPSSAGRILADDPYIVNKLTYTSAVIKEVMRLFAPAGTSRRGKAGHSVPADNGDALPTEDAMLWILHVEMHRNPKYWVRPDEFLPERFLVGPEHELHPKAGAWRPFEHGPRNCIASMLVMVELRVVLACLVRTVEVKDAYAEVDGRDVGEAGKYRGERAYQVEKGAAHPVGGFPCRVRCV